MEKLITGKDVYNWRVTEYPRLSQEKAGKLLGFADKSAMCRVEKGGEVSRRTGLIMRYRELIPYLALNKLDQEILEGK